MTDQELIEAMAIEVMGAKIVWEKSKENSKDNFLAIGPDNKPYIKLKGKWRDWNPLTDMNHAFMIIDKLIEKFVDEIQIEISRLEFNQKFVTLYIGEFPNHLEYKSGWQQSFGHAICLAAREALRSLKNGVGL